MKFPFIISFFISLSYSNNLNFTLLNEIKDEFKKEEINKAKILLLADKANLNNLSFEFNYTDKEVDLLYEIFDNICFYFPEEKKYDKGYNYIVNEKEKRNTFNKNEIFQVFKCYILKRNFANANSWKDRYKNLKFPYLPEKIIIDDRILSEKGYHIYKVDEKDNNVKLEKLSFNKRNIVMVFFTGCQMAQDLLSKLMANKEISNFIKKNSILLTEQFDVIGINNWKRHFGLENIYIIHSKIEFPYFDFSSSPNIYFLENGKKLDKTPKDWFSPKALKILKEIIK